MARNKIRLQPGGQLSDLVETALGATQYQQIVNLRQEKLGEWESVEGFKTVISGFTNIKAAIEISEDRSGDRFLLVQDGTDLKRVDYDISNSPNFGYENETPATITLPSGVTIGASAVLRFFYFRGVVRITGPSVPLWYGYIDRTIFPNSWSTDNLDNFNTGVDSWTGSSATVTQETASPLLEGAGTLQVAATGASGYAYKAFTVTANKKYKFFVKGFKASGQTSENYQVLIGTTQGGAQIATLTHGTDDQWHAFESEFTPTVTTIYISFSPIDSGDEAHFDYAWLRENHSIVLANWYLFETSLKEPTTSEVLSIAVRAHGNLINSVGYLQALGAIGLGYDESQYSLVKEDYVFSEFTGFDLLVTNVNRLCSGVFGVIEYDVTIDETLNNLYRITSLLLATYYQAGTGAVLNVEPGDYNVQVELDLTEEYEKGYVFTKSNFYIDYSSHPKRLNLWQVGDLTQRSWDGLFKVGRRIKIANSLGSVDTVITAYNESNSNDQLHYIEILDDIDEFSALATDMSASGVWIEKIWDYVAGTGYTMRTAAEIESAGEGSYPEVTDTPSGTENNTPNYTHHTIIEEVAYVASSEDEEEDAVRFSPIMQFDNFPIDNLIQTQVGDIDSTRAISKRANRLVMLKRNSISQGNFVGGSYYEDIGLHDSGLYALYGFRVIDDVLYYMDREEVFAFYGQRPVPLLVNEQQRNLYRSNVDENSLIFHDKIHNEIWFVLKGTVDTILVYHPERKEWYTRQTTIAPVTSFLDYDKKMLVAGPTSIVTYNHNYTTFDEVILIRIISKVFSDGTDEYYKKVNKIRVLMKGNSIINVSTGEAEGSTGSTHAFTPNATYITNNRVSPKYLFKSLEVDILPSVASTSLQASIRSIELEIEAWK